MLADPSTWHAARVTHLKGEIRNLYWHIRNGSRARFAQMQRYYRKVQPLKRELAQLGVPRREILDLIACCRSLRCRVPHCPHCGRVGFDWKQWD